MKNCVFCDYKDREVIVYEDDKCYAVICLDPINKHHVMVIPNKHYENFIDIPDNLASHLFLITKKLSLAVRKSCDPDAIHHISDDDIKKKGYNRISHYKVHIIPRFKGDGVKLEWNHQGVSLKERVKIAKEIKKQL